MTAVELDDRIAATVLMCPAAVLRDDAIRGNTMGVKYDPLDSPERVEIRKKVIGRNFITVRFPPSIYETAQRYHGKACVVHGTGDRTALYTYVKRFVDIWPGCEWHELTGYDHGFNPDPDAATCIAADFLIRTLAE